MCDTRKLILVFSQFHITEIICVAVSFTCRVWIMQVYFNVNNFMDTFKKLYRCQGLIIKFTLGEIFNFDIIYYTLSSLKSEQSA